MKKNTNLLSAVQINAMPAKEERHQFNEHALRLTRMLGHATGMEQLGVHLVRVPPGHETTQHHSHEANEEFIFILEGRATATIGDELSEVCAGDFMGFPRNSPAHSMVNDSEQDLVYLVAGERNLPDVVHYPRIKRTMIKSDSTGSYTDWSDTHDLGPDPSGRH